MWLVAFVLLVVLFVRIPLDAVLRSAARGPWLLLVLYMAFQGLSALMTDSWATQIAFATVGLRIRWLDLARLRGASYLLGLLNYALGQGGVGFALVQRGLSPSRVAAGIVLLIGINVATLIGFAGAARWIRPSLPGSDVLGVLLLVVVLAGCAWLAVLMLRFSWLSRWPVVDHLAKIGPTGYLKVILARVPHVLWLVITFWGALRLWGVPVPLAEGLALVPLVLVVVALPIAPNGIGTSQAVQVALFSQFAMGSMATERQAAVLAFGLAYNAIGLAVQASIGWTCLAWIRHASDRG